MIEIVDPGVLTTVQDRGRPGYASLGVPRSGAVDPSLARHVNRLAGNPDDVAVLETVGGFTFRPTRSVVVASDAEPMARSVGAGEAVHVAIGTRQWHYVAVRGGIDVEPALGSRSTDTLSGIGPPPLRPGDIVRIGPEPGSPPVGEMWPVRPPGGTIRLTRGPRWDWFADASHEALTTGEWQIADANRVGIRLAGPELHRTVDAELPSEGLVRGAIQIPPDGAPIMMLADHPTTGGYPVIAVVRPSDVAVLAQHPVGSHVRFHMEPSPAR